MPDLTTPKGIEDYLAHTPFAASSAVPLTGGYVNFTYRITLRKPFAAPGLDAPVPTLVLKHAEPHMAMNKEVLFAVERQEFECLAFKLVPGLVGSSSIVNLPTLYYEDHENGVIIMSDSGPKCRTLHETLQSGPISGDVAYEIGAELGAFIARLHSITRNPPTGSPAYAAKRLFEANHQGRVLTGSIFYDNIVSTLTKDSPLISPPLHLSPETLAKLHAISQNAQNRICISSEILNMGDFRPGNLLVVLEPTPHITVIDWEAARPGFEGIDLGQFLAELYHLRLAHSASRECINDIITAFLSTYRAIILENEVEYGEQRISEIAQDTATHMAAFMILLAPGIGDTELTSEVLRDAVEYMLRSSDGDRAWLRRSIVGGLWDACY